jgi:hypothetical protein
VSFGLLEWSVGMRSPEFTSSFTHDLCLSSRALVTLNDGDPKNAASQVLSVCEAGLGLAFLGLVVGYLPVLYQSFAKREMIISLLACAWRIFELSSAGMFSRIDLVALMSNAVGRTIEAGEPSFDDWGEDGRNRRRSC